MKELIPGTTAAGKPAYEDVRAVLSLRLLIARAANRDSLGWWDDDSLSAPAGYVLERLFPVAPPLAARSLALQAATTRHEAACPGRALHLYRLDADNQDGLAARQTPVLPIPYPEQPIATMAELRGHLLAILRQAGPCEIVGERSGGALELRIPPCPLGVWLPLHRARSLASAYLEGEPGRPVFPYIPE